VIPVILSLKDFQLEIAVKYVLLTYNAHFIILLIEGYPTLCDFTQKAIFLKALKMIHDTSYYLRFNFLCGQQAEFCRIIIKLGDLK
jgi:hypothetical protein